MSGLEVVQMSEDGNNGQAILELIEKRWPDASLPSAAPQEWTAVNESRRT